MMAFGHAASGWLTAMMIINALSLFHDQQAALLLLIPLLTGLAMAGAAILDDIDHPNSTITTAFGPFSRLAHQLVIELHYTVASATAEAGNRKLPGPHRGVTHWWPFPLCFGIITAIGSWFSVWFVFGMLVVLYTGAIRALTVPDYQPSPTDTVRHRWSMIAAHGIIDLLPFMLMLKKARKHVNRTYRVGGYWIYYRIPIGKIGTVVFATGLALMAIRTELIIDNRVWLGALVCIGMYLHILGDAPTEMGIPGWKLAQMWRLPKWLAFRAGGPFEVVCCWVPMTALGIYLIPGLRPREEVLMVQSYVLWGLGVAIVGAIGVQFGTRYMKKKEWIA